MSSFLLNLRVDSSRAGVRAPAGARDASGRAIGGQFLKGGAQGNLLRINQELAREVQAAVVANIQARILRRAASTNRLVTVTAAPENATGTFDTIRVGNEDFLNRSIAKYWRTIEEGSADVWGRPFVGTQLYPVGPGRPPFPVPHGARPGLRTFGGEDLKWMDGRRYVVKHEIAPMHAYRDAHEQVQPGQRAFRAVNAYLESIQALPTLGD